MPVERMERWARRKEENIKQQQITRFRSYRRLFPALNSTLSVRKVSRCICFGSAWGFGRGCCCDVSWKRDCQRRLLAGSLMVGPAVPDSCELANRAGG